MSIIICIATISQFSGGRFNGPLHQQSHCIRNWRTQNVDLNIPAPVADIYRSPDVTTDFWPMNHSVQNTTPRRSRFEELRNCEIIFVSLKWGMENSNIRGNWTQRRTDVTSSDINIIIITSAFCKKFTKKYCRNAFFEISPRIGRHCVV